LSTRFHTPLCEHLGIEHPIVQSGMGRIAGPELVAEVSAAGGLGVLAGLLVPPELLRAQVRRVRQLTDRPFGVNLWLHEELHPPVDAASIEDERIQAVQTVLDGFRSRLGLPPGEQRVASVPDLADAQLEMLLDERVPVLSVGLGNPGAALVGRFRDRGARVIAMACTVADARALAESGVDAVVAQGSEAGGHRSTWVKRSTRQAAAIGTMALVPQVVDAVKLPVIAAGGIADGRGLVASLALGAQAVLLGTRFAATRESTAPEFFKRAILAADGDATRITNAFTGLYARVIANRFLSDYEASGAPVLPGLIQANAAQDVYAKAAADGNADYFPVLAGQSSGLISDLPGAAEVVRALLGEAAAVRL